jgi:hypothetical protein
VLAVAIVYPQKNSETGLAFLSKKLPGLIQEWVPYL